LLLKKKERHNQSLPCRTSPILRTSST
jgi:hypothetical protein